VGGLFRVCSAGDALELPDASHVKLGKLPSAARDLKKTPLFRD
jgi:hypothetical protein